MEILFSAHFQYYFLDCWILYFRYWRLFSTVKYLLLPRITCSTFLKSSFLSKTRLNTLNISLYKDNRFSTFTSNLSFLTKYLPVELHFRLRSNHLNHEINTFLFDVNVLIFVLFDYSQCYHNIYRVINAPSNISALFWFF